MQVLEVYTNNSGEVLNWKVRWYTPCAGKHAGTEQATFAMLEGKQFTEIIDVETEALVGSTSNLVHQNKKLPKSLIKQAKAVLQHAANAEAHGEVTCNVCHKDEDASTLVACGCCQKAFHTACAVNYPHHDGDWWCPACEDND